MTKIFDIYDIKARLSVVIILVTPILTTLYLQVESIRNLASTVVVTVALLALSILLIIFIRYHGKQKHQKRDFVAEYLYPNNNKIERTEKDRLYVFLGSIDNSFSILYEQKEQPDISDEYKQACKSALNWLKEHSRDFDIVNKENAMYGFCRNLLAVKPAGIVISIIMIMIHCIQYKFNIMLICLSLFLNL